MEDRTPISTIQSPQTVQKSKPIESTPQSTRVDIRDSSDFNRMANFFEIEHEDRKEPKTQEQIKMLHEWAREKVGSDDNYLAMSAIKQLKSSLGINIQGKALVEKLHKYISIDREIKRLETEMTLII